MAALTSTVRILGLLKNAFNPHVPLGCKTNIIRQFEAVAIDLTRMKNIAYDLLFRFNAINGDAAVTAATAPNATEVTVRAAMGPLDGYMTFQGGVYATSHLFTGLLMMAHDALSSKF